MSSASLGGDAAAALAAPSHRRPRADTRGAHTETPPQDEAHPVIAAFLRALADRVEQDPAFGRALLAVYAQSCTATPQHRDASVPTSGKVRRRPEASQAQGIQSISPAATLSAPTEAPGTPVSPPHDPFLVLRAHGEVTLRSQLGNLDPASLRSVIRAHRLDPARISARWSARERLVDLIVEQVCARASLGRAFERV